MTTSIKSLWESSSYSKVKKWAAELMRGKGNVEDYERSGRPKEGTSKESV